MILRRLWLLLIVLWAAAAVLSFLAGHVGLGWLDTALAAGYAGMWWAEVKT